MERSVLCQVVYSAKLGLIKSLLVKSDRPVTMQRQKRFVLAEILSEEQEWYLPAYVYQYVWFQYEY
jgi:hypothetical protein